MENQKSGRRRSKDDIIASLAIENRNLYDRVKQLENKNKKLSEQLYGEMAWAKLLERRLELEKDS